MILSISWNNFSTFLSEIILLFKFKKLTNKDNTIKYKSITAAFGK